MYVFLLDLKNSVHTVYVAILEEADRGHGKEQANPIR